MLWDIATWEWRLWCPYLHISATRLSTCPRRWCPTPSTTAVSTCWKPPTICAAPYRCGVSWDSVSTPFVPDWCSARNRLCWCRTTAPSCAPRAPPFLWTPLWATPDASITASLSSRWSWCAKWSVWPTLLSPISPKPVSLPTCHTEKEGCRGTRCADWWTRLPKWAPDRWW